MSNLSSRPTQIIIGIMIIIALSACQPNAATIEPAVANTPTVQPSNTPVPTTTLAPTKISSLTSSATQRVEAVATSQPTPKELIYMNKVETKFIEPVLDGGKFEDLNGKLLGVLYEVAKPTNPGQLFYTKGVEVFKGSDGSIYSKSYIAEGQMVITRVKTIRYYTGTISTIIDYKDLGRLDIKELTDGHTKIFLRNAKYLSKEGMIEAIDNAVKGVEILEGELDFGYGVLK